MIGLSDAPVHCKRDGLLPYDIHPINQGRLLARKIPNAQFMILESNNHVPLLQVALLAEIHKRHGIIFARALTRLFGKDIRHGRR